MAPLRPEAGLLLSCARARKNPDIAQRIAACLTQPIDWDWVLRAGHRHTLVPLLHWHLRDLGPDAVPAAVLTRLRQHFYQNIRRNLLLASWAGRVVKLLGAHGIRAIPYKGPALAVAVYGGLSLRQFGDVDILVEPVDVPKAKALLLSAGFRPQFPVKPAQEAVLLRSQHPYAFVRDDGQVVLELHWSVSPRYLAFPPAALARQRLEPVSLASTTVLTFPPEVLLLVLCVHGAKHVWERLGWICDVAELVIRRTEMDWPRILTQARDWGNERVLLLGLLLAHGLLEAPLPREVLDTIRADPVVRSLAAHVRARLFADTDGAHGILENALFHLRAREHWRDRIRYCYFALTPTVADWARLSLPVPLSFLYYPLRVIRLLGNPGHHH